MSSNRASRLDRRHRGRMSFAAWVVLCVVAMTGCDRDDAPAEQPAAPVENEAAAAQPPPETSPPGATSAAVRIGRRPPRIGDTVREESTFEMRVLVQHVIDDEGGPSFERHSLDRTVKQVTVLGVGANGAVTEAEIAYETRSASLDQDGQTHTADSPLVGRRYRVVAAASGDEAQRDTELVVEYADLPAEDTDPGGDPLAPTDPAAAGTLPAAATEPAARWMHAARASLVSAVAVSGVSEVAERIDEAALVRVPPPDEVAEVRRDNHGLGEPDALREMLPAGALEPGAPTPMVREHVARLFAHGTTEAEVEVATLELDQVVERDGQRLAELVADLTVRVDDGEAMSMRLVLSGRLVVQVETGWIASMTLDGEVETAGRLERGESTTRMTGSGTVSMRYEARYQTTSL